MATMDDNLFASDLPTQVAYPIEWFKEQRQENRAFVYRAHRWDPADRIPELALNRVPQMAPQVWLDATAVDRGRRVFDCHVFEAREQSWGLFEAIVHATNLRQKGLRFEFVNYPTDSVPDAIKEGLDEREVFEERRDKYLQEYKIDLKDLREDLKMYPIPGEDLGSNELTPKKFPVFCTTDVPTDILDEFLELCSKGSTATVRSTAAAVILTSSSLLKGAPISKPPVRPFESPFKGKSPREILYLFQELVAPMDQNPSFWSTSCCIVLDEQTVRDRTCLVVSDVDGEFESRRCEELVVMDHVIPVEMMALSLAQCGQVDGGTLTMPMLRRERNEYDMVKTMGTVARTAE